MAALIAEVRRLAHAGLDEHTLGITTYWTDDQLQERLDRYRKSYRRVDLEALPEYTDGGYVYKEYPIPLGDEGVWLERGSATVDAAAGFAIRDSAGGSAPANTVNWEARVITFGGDQAAEVYYLDARVYDVYRAAADVWEDKAGFYEDEVDWQSDNHRFADSQKAAHAREKAEALRRQSGAGVSRLVRTDVLP